MLGFVVLECSITTQVFLETGNYFRKSPVSSNCRKTPTKLAQTKETDLLLVSHGLEMENHPLARIHTDHISLSGNMSSYILFSMQLIQLPTSLGRLAFSANPLVCNWPKKATPFPSECDLQFRELPLSAFRYWAS